MARMMSASDTMLFMLFFISMLVVLSEAQAPPLSSPSPALDCLTATIANNMGECIPYVLSNSTMLSPAVVCCQGLSSFVMNDVSCLCQLLRFVDVHDRLPINRTRVTSLPTVCSVTPFLFQCQNTPQGPEIMDSPPTTSSSTATTSNGMLHLAAVLFAAIATF